MENTVTIPESEYHDLKSDAAFLAALQAAGIDNWEGYDYAQELFQEEDE